MKRNRTGRVLWIFVFCPAQAPVWNKQVGGYGLTKPAITRWWEVIMKARLVLLASLCLGGALAPAVRAQEKPAPGR
jgi:hypothetical protein